jgi:hypothetical protein
MNMDLLIPTILLVFVIIYFVPFVVYGSLSAAGWIEQPEGSPARFLVSIMVSKLATAVVFVLIFHLALAAFGDRWLLYAFLWWIMFAVGEVGQAIGPSYSWREAFAGIISETLYFPVAAWAMWGLIGKG